MEVAPLVGAWIETSEKVNLISILSVAPLVGAWIETKIAGLNLLHHPVAPLVGAWIETKFKRLVFRRASRRTPRGCVD